MTRWWGWMLVLAIGCAKGHVETSLAVPAAVYERARARVIPDLLRARFNVKIRSKPLDIAGSTGGGLVIDRPGSARIDLFGPLGSPLLTVTSDGAGLSVLLIDKQRQLVATDAEAVLREATHGSAGLDDILAVLVGELPFEGAPLRSIEPVGDGTKPDEDGIRVLLEGPRGTTVVALIDPELGTPKRIEALDPKLGSLLVATYDRFESVGDVLLPTRVEVTVPSVDLTLEARYREWSVLSEPPKAFSVQAPAGYTTESLEVALRRVIEVARP